MTLMLGLNLGHDGAAAIVKDGRLIGAVARERITRIKKDRGVDKATLDYILGMANAKLSDVDIIGFTGFEYRPDNYVKVLNNQDKEVGTWFDIDFRTGAIPCRVSIDGVKKNAMHFQHHLSHAASTFFTSPFDKAACFTLDASGRSKPEASSMFAYGNDNKIFPFYCPGLMIGNAYSEFTPKLGLGPGLTKAGTLMGLAAYGQVKHLDWSRYAQSFYDRCLQPNDQVYIERMWSEITGRAPHDILTKEQSDSQESMDIAATLQFIFEEVIVEWANILYRDTKTFNGDNICLSGGSFLNCNVNTAIKTHTPFKNVHLFPGCGDDGTAVGAALLLSHIVAGEPRQTYTNKDLAYLGRKYSTPDIGKSLNIKEVAKRISEGSVVAWFQGRSEFGPRALGNRSILADPCNPKMRDLINSEVKHREWFRPFAPSVLAEYSKDWFNLEGESPFMLHTAMVKKAEIIPAVTHVDNTARHQTVKREDNPIYYDLIDAFREITGVPMLLNTSLNNNNEPLVETPEDAIKFFDRTKNVDTLVINDRMVFK